MHSNEDKKESVERAERLQGEHRARASQLDRNWAPSVLLALLAKAPGRGVVAAALSTAREHPSQTGTVECWQFSRGVYWSTEVEVLQYYLQLL